MEQLIQHLTHKGYACYEPKDPFDALMGICCEWSGAKIYCKVDDQDSKTLLISRFEGADSLVGLDHALKPLMNFVEHVSEVYPLFKKVKGLALSTTQDSRQLSRIYKKLGATAIAKEDGADWFTLDLPKRFR